MHACIPRLDAQSTPDWMPIRDHHSIFRSFSGSSGSMQIASPVRNHCASMHMALLALATLLLASAPALGQHIREGDASGAINPMYKEADLGNGHSSTVKGDTVFATFMPYRRPPPNPLACTCTDVDPHPTFITRPNFTCWCATWRSACVSESISSSP